MTSYMIAEELMRLSELKDLFSKIVEDSPPGHASTRKLKSGKISIYHEYTSKDARRVRRSLKSPEDDELLERLKIKNFALKALPILKGNINFLSGGKGAQFTDFDPLEIERSLGAAYKGIYSKIRVSNRLKSGSEKFDAIAERQNPFPVDGERSLSESVIDILLDLYHIPHKYEPAFKAGPITYYPDFAILSPRTGEIVYWEHFGKMSDEEYARGTVRKLADYAHHGLCLGINLIASFSSNEKRINRAGLEAMVKAYLLPRNIKY